MEWEQLLRLCEGMDLEETGNDFVGAENELVEARKGEGWKGSLKREIKSIINQLRRN